MDFAGECDADRRRSFGTFTLKPKLHYFDWLWIRYVQVQQAIQQIRNKLK